MALVALVVALGGPGWAADQLAKNSVGSVQIKNGAVKGADLKNNAVTSAKVKDGSLLRTDFAAGQLPDPLGAPEPWKPLNFAAGWADYGGGQVTASYRKDQLGKVHLRGFITKTAGAPGFSQTMAMLPSGYRPGTPANMHFAVAVGRPDGAGTVYVTPTGEVGWMSGNNGEPDYVDLAGVSFWTD